MLLALSLWLLGTHYTWLIEWPTTCTRPTSHQFSNWWIDLCRLSQQERFCGIWFSRLWSFSFPESIMFSFLSQSTHPWLGGQLLWTSSRPLLSPVIGQRVRFALHKIIYPGFIMGKKDSVEEKRAILLERRKKVKKENKQTKKPQQTQHSGLISSLLFTYLKEEESVFNRKSKLSPNKWGKSHIFDNINNGFVLVFL